jgi:hypothetical protein
MDISMKIGWLVWEWEDNERPTLFKDGEEPSWAHKKIKIVYAEVMEESV